MLYEASIFNSHFADLSPTVRKCFSKHQESPWQEEAGVTPGGGGIEAPRSGKWDTREGLFVALGQVEEGVSLVDEGVVGEAGHQAFEGSLDGALPVVEGV